MSNRPKAFLGVEKDFVPQEIPILGWTAVVDRVHDGDTILIVASIGLDRYVPFWARVFNLLASELYEPLGPEARDAMEAELPAGTILKVRTYYKTFERWAAVIRRPSGQLVAETLLKDHPDLFRAKGPLAPENEAHVRQARYRDEKEMETRSAVG